MLQVLLILIVYIVGPAVILIWAIKRLRQGQRPKGVEIGIVVLAVALIALFTYAYTWNVSDRDRNDAQTIVRLMTERYTFPSARFQDRPAVSAEAKAREIEVRVYGVVENDAQQQVTAIARDLRRQVAAKPIVLQFYAEERWEIHPDGTRLHHPEQEVPIRERRIE